MSTELIADLPPALKDHASWLINAGADDTARILSQMEATPEAIRTLKAAIATERSKPKLQQRVSRLKPIEAKLRKFESEGPHRTPDSKVATVTVAPAPAVILAGAVKSMEKLRAALGKQEDAFWAATLGARLQIGLQCLKAYQVFVIPEAGKRNKSGKNQHSKGLVTRDVASPEGFEGWLLSDASWLKKPTAYKYMTAVRGLGCDHDSTEKQVAAALKLLQRKGPVTLKSLCDAAVEAIGPPPAPPEKIEQSEFEFLRDGLSAFREAGDAILALKTQLHENPDMERVATARVYGLLYQLTGTHWKPSDEPDDLASVNPDSIEL